MKRFDFPCGCSFPIDESRPRVNGQGAIVLDIENVPWTCKATWDLISSGLTKGIFQLESSLGKTWAKKLQPDNLNHLAALVALLRPGTLKAKDADGVSMTERYVRRKLGIEETEYYVPALESILGDTYGVLVYQEQAMAIASKLAGFDLREADMLRKAIGKKDTETMAKTKKLFMEKSKAAGIITEEQAEFIFGNIQKSQRYSFNKCLSFDTKLMMFGSRSSLTLEQMYNYAHYEEEAAEMGYLDCFHRYQEEGHYGYGFSMAEDGYSMIPNLIEEIQPAGIQKVYRITLENGASIRATGNHKFPTSCGELTVDEFRDHPKVMLKYFNRMSKLAYAYSTPIISIEEDGECMTYDVTMEGPDHNFATLDGIVTCNSHAVGYGLTGYHTAYMKAHFPLQFYTSYLFYAKEKQDPAMEIKELINDAKHFGIKVMPPRFAEVRPHFNTNGVTITFGLSDIKGIGEGQIINMRPAIAEAEKFIAKSRFEWTWYDFLVYVSSNIKSDVVTKMIESGALAYGNLDRQLMLAEYNAWRDLNDRERKNISTKFAPTSKEEAKLLKEGQEIALHEFTNLTDAIEHLLIHPKGVFNASRRKKVESILALLKKPARSVKDSPDWISRTEQKNLGISLTCNLTDRGDTSLVNLSCKDYREGKGNDTYVVLGVTVEDMREVEVKTGPNVGKKMAFVTVSDDSGMLDDVTFFSDAWERFSNDVFPGSPIMLQGKRDMIRGSLLVENIWRI